MSFKHFWVKEVLESLLWEWVWGQSSSGWDPVELVTSWGRHTAPTSAIHCQLTQRDMEIQHNHNTIPLFSVPWRLTWPHLNFCKVLLLLCLWSNLIQLFLFILILKILETSSGLNTWLVCFKDALCSSELSFLPISPTLRKSFHWLVRHRNVSERQAARLLGKGMIYSETS